MFLPTSASARPALRRLHRLAVVGAATSALLLSLSGPALAADPVAAPPAEPAAAAPAARPATQTLVRRILPGGLEADVVDPGGAITALVVVNHQLFSTPLKVRQETQLMGPAAGRRWLLVYPEGHLSSWNAGRCCGPSRDQGFDDTTALRAAIAGLRAEYGLGRSVPTVMGGISNGAMETAQFFCRAPGVLDAAFLDAGNAQDPDCTRTSRVTDLLMTRGARDSVVPVGGTMWSGFLRTPLFDDRVLLDAFRRGTPCRTAFRSERDGVRTTLEQCGSRSLKLVQDQAQHSRPSGPRRGVVDRTALTIAFVDAVVRKKQIAAGA